VSTEWQQRLAQIIAKRAQRRERITQLRQQLAAARIVAKAAAHNDRLRNAARKDSK